MRSTLSKKNASAFEMALAPYIDAGRRVRGAATHGGRTAGGPTADLNAIREWARANGHTVSNRGRIATSIIEAYNADR